MYVKRTGPAKNVWRARAGEQDVQKGLCGLKKRLYVSNIQGRGGTKIPDLECRTHNCDNIVLLETNCRQGDENSIKLGCQAVALASTEGKGLAYGTAVMSKQFNPDFDCIKYRSEKFEIVAISEEIAMNTKMAIIGAYRSPSMPVGDTVKFYQELRQVAKDCSDHDIILQTGK